MNKVEQNNLVIEDYTDMQYFNEVVLYVDEHLQEVLNFFGLTELKSNWKIQFLPYEDFKNYMTLRHVKCQPFIRGDTSRTEKTIRVLNVEDSIRYTTHKDTDVCQICKMIIHELSHACYSEVLPEPILWFNEGIAQNLAHQHKIINDVSDSDFSFLLNHFYEYSSKSYPYSYYIVKYLLENYPQDEIQRLLIDKDYLISRTNDIFDEVKIWIKEKMQNKEKKKPIL